jgi:hypothetical protein
MLIETPDLGGSCVLLAVCWSVVSSLDDVKKHLCGA